LKQNVGPEPVDLCAFELLFASPPKLGAPDAPAVFSDPLGDKKLKLKTNCAPPPARKDRVDLPLFVFCSLSLVGFVEKFIASNWEPDTVVRVY